jgi:hypothetical protein
MILALLLAAGLGKVWGQVTSIPAAGGTGSDPNAVTQSGSVTVDHLAVIAADKQIKDGGAPPTAYTTVNGQTCTLGGTCTITIGTGTVTSSGTPTIHQIPIWTTATDAKGYTLAANAILAGVNAADPAGKSIADLMVTGYVTGGGNAQAQTATLAPAATALTAGLLVRWIPAAANTAGAPTLAVNSLTATAITKCGATAVVANDLTTTAVAWAVYDGTQFQLLNPMAVPCGKPGTAGVADSATGNAGTATALAANGANCSAGQVAAGVDASGAAEGCTTSINGTAIPSSKTLMATDTAVAAAQLTVGSVLVGQKFFGTSAPGSVTGNLPGDTFVDTTAHNAYICNAPGGTAAPACTSVTAVGWMLLNDGNTGGATAMTQTTANNTDNTVSVSVGTSGRAFEKTPVTIDPSTGAVAGAASYRTAASAAAGLLGLTQGTACTPGTTEVCIYAPASVTSYGMVLPAAVGSSGVLHWGVSSTVATLSSSAVVAADTDTSIAHTGVDINTSHQVTATHLAAGLPIAQGGVVGTTAAVGSVPSASSTSAASWTVTPTIGNPGTSSGTWTFGNATGTGTWTLGASPTTTTNTLLGPTAVPTTGHLLDCTTSSTTCTLHDSGVVTANVVNASSPVVGLAHFAGSTQTVTSSLVVAADVTANTLTRAKLDFLEHHFVITGSGTAGVLQDTDDQPTIWVNHSGANMTITNVWCETDSASALTMNLQRDDGSPVDIMSSALSCTSTEATSSTFTSGENVIADGHRVDFTVVAAGGSAKWVSVHFKVTF